MQDERTLISRCQRGDDEALAQLVDEHKRKVSNIIYRMTRDGDATEDLTQEVCLRVFRGLQQFRGEASLSTWIYRITHRVCLRELERRQRRGNQVEWNDEVNEWHLRGSTPDESPTGKEVERAEMADAVARWMEELLPHYRMVVSLYYIEDRKYREITEIMNLPMGSVKTYLHRAKQFLRQRVLEEGFVA